MEIKLSIRELDIIWAYISATDLYAFRKDTEQIISKIEKLMESKSESFIISTKTVK